mgnify:CR=1 FL=1
MVSFCKRASAGGALGCCKGVVRCKDAERSSLFDRTEHFPPRTHRAHCTAIAGREAQWSKSSAVHSCTPKQSTHSKEMRTMPHISQALHQREARSGEQCTNVSALFAQHSNHLRSKPEARFPQVCTPKPLFFFSTVHGALLFLRVRRKRRGGCIPTKE